MYETFVVDFSLRIICRIEVYAINDAKLHAMRVANKDISQLHWERNEFPKQNSKKAQKCFLVAEQS